MANKKTEIFNEKLKNPTKPKSVENTEIDNKLLDYANKFINKNTERNILKSINSKENTVISIDYLKPNLFQKLFRKSSKIFKIKALVSSRVI